MLIILRESKEVSLSNTRMSNTARKGSIALLMAMKGLKQRSSARQQIRTMYYLTKRYIIIITVKIAA